MINKNGFELDPTQVEKNDTCSCSGIDYDWQSGAWKARATITVDVPDCANIAAQLEATKNALDVANAANTAKDRTIAALTAQLEVCRNEDHTCPPNARVAVLERELTAANNTIVAKDREIAELRQRPEQCPPDQRTEVERLTREVANGIARIADLRSTISGKDNRIAELEAENSRLKEQLENQPTVCDVLRENLEPIHRVNGDVIYYGLKNADGCPALNAEEVETVGGQGGAGTTVPVG